MGDQGSVELTKKELWIRRGITFILIIVLIIGIFMVYKLSTVPEGKYASIVISETSPSDNVSALQEVRKKYGAFSHVVIISPQDTLDEFGFYESFPESGKYCYKGNCIDGKALDKNLYLGVTSGNLFTKTGDNAYKINSPSIGSTIESVNEVFPEVESYSSFILKRSSVDDIDVRKLKSQFSIRSLESSSILFIAVSDINIETITKSLTEKKKWDYISKISDRRDMTYDSSCNNCIGLARLIANRLGQNNFKLGGDNKYGVFVEEQIESKPDNIVGLWFGDTHFTRAFTSGRFLSEPEYFSCFISTKHIGESSYNVSKIGDLDIMGANFKSVVASPEVCKQGSNNIVTLPEKLKYFKDTGFTHVSLANNNTYTCGSKGYAATKDSLSKYGIEPFGMDAKTNVISRVIKGDQKIALMGLSDTLARIPLSMVQRDIEKLKSEGYEVVINVNWGSEYTLKPNKRQQYLAKKFIDYGADLIIGYHPHILQNVDVYKGKKIYYSIGNFMYDQPFVNTLKAGAVFYELTGDGLQSELITFERDPKTYKIKCDTIKEEE